MTVQVKQLHTENATSRNGLLSEDSFVMALLSFLEKRCLEKLQLHFDGKHGTETVRLPQPTQKDRSPLATFFRTYELTDDESILFLTVLVPHIIPGFFDALVHRFLPTGGEFPEFGGVKGQNHRGTLPTGETVLFILAGMHPEVRMSFLHLFDEDQFLFKHKILSIQPVASEPRMSGRLVMEKEFVEVFTTGKVPLPKLSMDFPAEHIVTELEWSDLVLSPSTMDQIREIEHWINHHETLMVEWEMYRKLKPGYRALFYGPPGTGKTLTAMLLGKYTGRDVFRIDLSMVVSKYIGETEKNLASLFERAEHKNWILFFDEADAIFGKRTGVRDAHDKYANQEVSYLLQRIESHSGLSILASNFKNNIDQAFMRRFNSIIYFPVPGYEERLMLWQKSFPARAPLAPDITFNSLAVSYELTGAQIMNIVQYTCLQSLSRNGDIITKTHIEAGIRRENTKEGK